MLESICLSCLSQFLGSLPFLFERKHLLCQTQSIAQSLPLQVFLQAIHHCAMAALRYAQVSLIKAKDASQPAPKEMRGEGGLEPLLHPSPFCFIHVLSGSLVFASCSLSITRILQQVPVNCAYVSQSSHRSFVCGDDCDWKKRLSPTIFFRKSAFSDNENRIHH